MVKRFALGYTFGQQSEYGNVFQNGLKTKKRTVQWPAWINVYFLLMHLLRFGWKGGLSCASLWAMGWVSQGTSFSWSQKGLQEEKPTLEAQVKPLLVWCLLNILAEASHGATPKAKQWGSAFLPWRLAMGREWVFVGQWSSLPQGLNLMNRAAACEAHAFLA